jgi:hypothetical protein
MADHWSGAFDPERGNPYRRRLEDIDPARRDPSTTVEHPEPTRERAGAFTVEGTIQRFGDLADAALATQEPRRFQARLFVFVVLLAILTPVALQLLGLLRLFG